jgi:hypothetical protein
MMPQCLAFQKHCLFFICLDKQTNTIVEPVDALTLLVGNTVACLIVFSNIECSPASYKSRRGKEFTSVRDSLVFCKFASSCSSAWTDGSHITP